MKNFYIHYRFSTNCQVSLIAEYLLLSIMKILSLNKAFYISASQYYNSNLELLSTNGIISSKQKLQT